MECLRASGGGYTVSSFNKIVTKEYFLSLPDFSNQGKLASTGLPGEYNNVVKKHLLLYKVNSLVHMSDVYY